MFFTECAKIKDKKPRIILFNFYNYELLNEIFLNIEEQIDANVYLHGFTELTPI